MAVLSAGAHTLERCGADPRVSQVIEGEETVQVEVVATTASSDTNECLDSARLELSGPLGDRTIVDVTSGRTIPVAQRATDS